MNLVCWGNTTFPNLNVTDVFNQFVATVILHPVSHNVYLRNKETQQTI